MGLNFESWMILGSLLVGTLAVFWDLKYRKIPNWLTFPGMVLGIVLHLIFNANAWYFSFLGISFGFLMLFIPFILGGIGAGDVKLLMALGAFLGVKTVVWTGLYGGVAGGLLSVCYLLRQYGFFNTQYRLWLLLTAIWNQADRKKLQSLNETPKLYVPYGLAIVIGLVFSLIWEPF